jgi:hypothetical protein
MWPLLALGASALFSLCNPWGAGLYAFHAGTFGEPLFRSILEWRSPLELGVPGFRSWLYVPLVAGFGLLSLRDLRLLPPGEWLFCWGTLVLSLGSRRFIPLFALTVLPLCVECLGRRVGPLLASGRAVRFLRPASAGLLLLLAVGLRADRIGFREVGGAFARIVGERSFPVAACDFLERRGDPPRRILNFYGWGGYLSWRFYPRSRVLWDGRAQMVFPPELFEAGLRLEREGDWRGLVSRWAPDALFLNARLQGRVRAEALAGGEWRVVYADGLAVVLELRGSVPRSGEPGEVGRTEGVGRVSPSSGERD